MDPCWTAVGRRWTDRGSTVKTPWTDRIIPTPGAVKTAGCTAGDGHELTADLYGKGHRLGEPHKLLVTCHPRAPAFVDSGTAPPEETVLVGRHPTYPEVIDAADLLAPGTVFHILFVACPPGIEREAVDEDGAQAVQADQIGEAVKSTLIELATA